MRKEAITNFPKNCWYMAGWSDELADGLLSRRIADRPTVLYRLSDGTVAALLDRCPHRFAPLSLGERDGDALVCPYHGLTFDAGGTCIRNPFSDRIPAAAHVPAWTRAVPGRGARSRQCWRQRRSLAEFTFHHGRGSFPGLDAHRAPARED